MRTYTTNNPHMAKRATRNSGYRPLEELSKRTQIDTQFPPCIDPFRITLRKNFVERGPKYIPVGPNKRYAKIDKTVNLMLDLNVGKKLNVYQTEAETLRLMAKAKKICPNGQMEIVNVTPHYCIVICTKV
jgi:hypothetical protein